MVIGLRLPANKKDMNLKLKANDNTFVSVVVSLLTIQDSILSPVNVQHSGDGQKESRSGLFNASLFSKETWQRFIFIL